VKLLRTPAELIKWSENIHRKGLTIGLVPTMGYLHEGHLSLMKRAKAENDKVLLTVFVNPSQFAPGEDYRSYPRNLKRDKRLAGQGGADAIYAPKARTVYPLPYRTYINVEELSGVMCGVRRESHFKGVTTIVGKLFNLSSADRAYFGRKDFQQSVIIGQMIRDLDFKVKLRVLPIVRARGGLAESSRNKYLTGRQRKQAISIYQSLREARKVILGGERRADRVRDQITRRLKKAGLSVDYVTVGEAKSLDSVKVIGKNTYIAIAAFCGKTRLIDNMLIKTTRHIIL